MVEECYYHGFNYGGLTKTLIDGGKSKVLKKEIKEHEKQKIKSRSQCLKLLGINIKLRKITMRQHLELNGVGKYNWPKI